MHTERQRQRQTRVAVALGNLALEQQFAILAAYRRNAFLGKVLFDDVGEDSRWVTNRKVDASPQAALYRKFGIRSTGGYWVPLDFLRISTGWYMNHDAEPNLGSDDGDVTYYALRDIPAGEELTIDYRRMDDKYDNLSRDVRVPVTAAAKPLRTKKAPRGRQARR